MVAKITAAEKLRVQPLRRVLVFFDGQMGQKPMM